MQLVEQRLCEHVTLLRYVKEYKDSYNTIVFVYLDNGLYTIGGLLGSMDREFYNAIMQYLSSKGITEFRYYRYKNGKRIDIIKSVKQRGRDERKASTD